MMMRDPDAVGRRLLMQATLALGWTFSSAWAFLLLICGPVGWDLPARKGAVAQQPSGLLVDRVIVIVVDALRADMAEDSKFLRAWCSLARQGVWGTHRTGPFPVSASFYKAFLAGRSATLWDVYEDLSPRPRGLRSWVSEAGLPVFFAGPASAAAWLPQDLADRYCWPLDRMEAIPHYDRVTYEVSARWLSSQQRGIFLSHFALLDFLAHRYGGNSSQYRRGCLQMDEWLERLRHLARPRDLWILVSDHGVRDDGGHSHDGAPEVSNAPFAAAGPGLATGIGPVSVDQRCWPLLLAAAVNAPFPDVLEGPVNLSPLNHEARQRAFLALQHVSQQFLKSQGAWSSWPRLLTIRSESRQPIGLGAHGSGANTPEALVQHFNARLLEAQEQRRTLAQMLLFGSTTVGALMAVSAWAALPGSFRSRRARPVRLETIPSSWSAVARGGLWGLALVAAGTALCALAWAGQVEGRIEELPGLDWVPEFRAHVWLQRPLDCLLVWGALVLLWCWLRVALFRRFSPALFSVVLAVAFCCPSRKRNDLALYLSAAVLSVELLAAWDQAWPTWRSQMKRTGWLSMAGWFAWLALGQKLSYGEAARTEQLLYASVSLGLAAVLSDQLYGRTRWLSLLWTGLFGISVCLRVLGWDAWVGKSLYLIGLVTMLGLATDKGISGRLILSLMGLAVVWLFKLPQQGALLALLLGIAARGGPVLLLRRLARRAGPYVGLAVGLAVSVAVFFYTDGRDSYPPINAFYRAVFGLERQGATFSMGWAALAVALRYALYAWLGLAVALRVAGRSWSEHILRLWLSCWLLRCTAALTPCAVFGIASWNYWASLCLNDSACVVASSVGVGLGAGTRWMWCQLGGSRRTSLPPSRSLDTPEDPNRTFVFPRLRS
jgi:hypothetical protein